MINDDCSAMNSEMDVAESFLANEIGKLRCQTNQFEINERNGDFERHRIGLNWRLSSKLCSC